MRRTEALIAREEAAVEAQLAQYRARLQGKRVLLYTGGVKSWSVVSALQDLGMKVVATGTRKSTEEDKARIRELMGEDAIMLDEGNPRLLLDVVYQQKADMMIAGGRNMFTAYKGNPDHAGRYIVGGLSAAELPADASFATILSAVNALAISDASRDAETLGAWIDKGTLYLDLGDTWTALPAAMQAAQYRGELAIWDRVEGTEIRVEDWTD